VVTHGIHGRLVPSGNVDAIAGALRWCLRKPDKARQMGERGRAKVLEHYSLDRMADAYRKRYERVLAVEPDRGDP
jgi:glycosyltransferase involved in cell wall biosynthesis